MVPIQICFKAAPKIAFTMIVSVEYFLHGAFLRTPLSQSTPNMKGLTDEICRDAKTKHQAEYISWFNMFGSFPKVIFVMMHMAPLAPLAFVPGPLCQ